MTRNPAFQGLCLAVWLVGCTGTALLGGGVQRQPSLQPPQQQPPHVDNPAPDGGSSNLGGGNTDAGSGSSGSSCLTSAFSLSVGKTRVLMGARMDNSESAVFAAAPAVDVRYQYVTGYVPEAPTACTSCSNSGCSGNWWGCYGSSPGSQLRNFVNVSAARGTLPMLTYYQMINAANGDSSATDLAAVQDSAVLRSYLNDLRFLLQQLGTQPALLHLEPDFWGNLEYPNTDATQTAAAVTAANPTDCASQPNTLAGLGHCMISMVRKYAPKTLVGLHASPWSTGVDCYRNLDSTLDVVAEAHKTAAFLRACGADLGDFVVVETQDRDAGALGSASFWDVNNQTLPNFHRSFAWAKTIADDVGKPLIWWQTPVGNMTMDSVHQDNRIDYFFSHMNELVAAHTAAVVFGAGQRTAAWIDTNPTTCAANRYSDHGYCLGKIAAYLQTGGINTCP